MIDTIVTVIDFVGRTRLHFALNTSDVVHGSAGFRFHVDNIVGLGYIGGNLFAIAVYVIGIGSVGWLPFQHQFTRVVVVGFKMHRDHSPVDFKLTPFGMVEHGGEIGFALGALIDGFDFIKIDLP